MASQAYSPSYRFTIEQIVDALRQFVAATDHKFWPDSVSVRDSQVFKTDRIVSARQLTDLYLLALAVEQNGRLATFEQGIALAAVTGATAAGLCIL